MSSRRHFGTVRKRPSGMWQAIYRDGGRLCSAGVFHQKADALARLSEIETDMRRGSWVDPRAGEITVNRYATDWLARRTGLAVRTRELYGYLLNKHINPKLGELSLVGLSPSKVRRWNSDLARDHPSTAAKAYRLLSTIMKTAVIDGVIASSPCRVVGASTERAEERPLATVSDIDALTKAMPDHLKAVVPLAVWCQLRRGEILGLHRADIDFNNGAIHIERSRTFSRNGTSIVKTPKTRSGRRVIAVPDTVLEILATHFDQFVAPEEDAFLFTSPRGSLITATALQRAWTTARVRAGRVDLHLHDLRHTGLTLAAATGATTAELMHRAGHASPDAALRYQHATRDRDRVIAIALNRICSESTQNLSGTDLLNDRE